MLSIRHAVALVAPLVFVACGDSDGLFQIDLFGPAEPTSIEPSNPRLYDRLCFEGYVRSAAVDRPVSGATVGIVGSHTVSTRTESSGYYALDCAPHHLGGAAYLRARKDGWSVQDIRDIQYSTEPQRYDFSLEPR